MRVSHKEPSLALACSAATQCVVSIFLNGSPDLSVGALTWSYVNNAIPLYVFGLFEGPKTRQGEWRCSVPTYGVGCSVSTGPR